MKSKKLLRGDSLGLQKQIALLAEDWRANSGNTRGRVVVFLFRMGKSARCFWGGHLFFFPFVLLYNLIVRYVMGIDLPLSTEIGGGLKIFHGMGLVVHPNVVIGRNCTLRQGVTLGERKTGSLAVPLICDDVEFGCNSIVLGSVTIGDGALVGAGSVVLHSIPSGGVVAGAAASLIRVVQ